MKTILIAHNYTENSFASMSLHLANHLANLGHQVIFISYRPYFHEPKVFKIDNGEIIVYSWPTKGRPTTIKDFIWYSKIHLKHKPNYVLTHFAGSNIVCMVSKLLSFGKTVINIYNHTVTEQLICDIGKNLKFKIIILRKKFFYHIFCNNIICPSEFSRTDFIKYFKNNNGIVILNPMIDRESNYIQKNKPNNIVISYLGRFEKIKGVIDLVDAFIKFKSENMQSKMVLNLAGSGSQIDDIKSRLENVKDIYLFNELPYNKIDEYVTDCHYVIIPSKQDAFNVVGVEAMMNKTPLLISKTTGLSEYLIDGKECYKFEANIDDMVNIFKKVEANLSKQNEMAFFARNTYLEKFTIEKYCETMTNLFV
jgi:glycosyltransferase involved in cell wall biosynthesis